MSTNYFNLDETLEKIGFFGRYQLKSLLILFVCIITSRIFGNVYMFHSLALNYRCLIAECEAVETAEYGDPWVENAVPFTSGRPDHCLRYMKNETALEFCEPESFDPSKTDGCNGKYVFETEFFTIVKQFGLYCDNNLWKLSLTGTVYNFGSMTGMFMAGHVSDRFGRRTTLVCAILIAGSIVILKGFFATTYIYLLFFEYVGQIAGCAIHISLFVLVTETIGSPHRFLGACLVSAVAAASQGLLGVVSLFVNDWRTLSKIAGTIPFAVVIYGWGLTESLRWLIAKGKYDKVNKTIEKMGEVNGVALTEKDFITKEKDLSKIDSDVHYSFSDILKSSILTIRLVKLCSCWILCTIILYGLTISSTTLSPDFKTNYILCYVVEVTGNVCLYFASKFLGRKQLTSFSFLFVGVSCCSFIFVEDETLSIISFLLGRFFSAISISALYVFTTDLFPTTYRQRCLGLCSTFGRVGAMIAPQMPLIAAYTFETAPFALFGLFGFMAGGLALTLPETNGTTLPATIYEAENLKVVKKVNSEL